MHNRTKILDLIRSFGSNIFHVCWIKKDGSIRTANVRRYVKKSIKGTGRRVSQPDNSLLPVYLMHNLRGWNTWENVTAWRALNLDTILYVKCNGKVHHIDPDPISDPVDTAITNTNDHGLQTTEEKI